MAAYAPHVREGSEEIAGQRLLNRKAPLVCIRIFAVSLFRVR